MLRLADILAILIGGLVAYFLRFGVDIPSPDYFVVLLITILIAANLLEFSGCYKSPEKIPPYNFIRVLLVWVSVATIVLAGLFFMKLSIQFSRGWFLYWLSVSAALLILNRILLVMWVRWLKINGLTRSRVALVGDGQLINNHIHTLQRAYSGNSFLVGGFVSDPQSSLHVQGVPAFGSIDDLLSIVKDGKIDEVILAYPESDNDEMQDMLKLLRSHPIRVSATVGFSSDQIPIIGASRSADMFLLHLHDRPLTAWDEFKKTIEDKLAALALLILFAPLMLIIAILIKATSTGPVLFVQKRYGFANNEISVFKFRSMYQHKDKDGFIEQATETDPRVTPIGKILRRTSLDELPQLFNVLGGSMSLVGPRPHAVSHNAYYGEIIDGYLNRHRVKPGITGWAQVNGLRGETNTVEQMRTRLEYDLYYIDNWSIMFDIRIVLATPFAMLSLRNAY